MSIVFLAILMSVCAVVSVLLSRDQHRQDARDSMIVKIPVRKILELDLLDQIKLIDEIEVWNDDKTGEQFMVLGLFDYLEAILEKNLVLERKIKKAQSKD